MGTSEKPLGSGVITLVIIAAGISTILLVAFGVGNYYFLFNESDGPGKCPDEECGSKSEAPSEAKSTECRAPTLASFAKPIDCYDNACWQFEKEKFNAQCIDGHCECNTTHYSRVSCLPCVGACLIQELQGNLDQLHAIPFSTQYSRLQVFSCIGEAGSFADVHVLGVNENIERRPLTAGTINVQISASSSRPKILVLTNYEPVHWVLNFTGSIDIEKVILSAYYSDQSSVTTVNGNSHYFTREIWPGILHGFGDDSGGGNTAEILVELYEEFGAVTSFAGTYQADSWIWNLPASGDEMSPTAPRGNTKISTSMPSGTTSTVPSAEGVIPCTVWRDEETCFNVGSPTQFDAQCVNGFCECHAPIYDRFTCLPSVGSCQIRQNSPDPHATPHVSGSSNPTVYSCIGQGGNTAEVHILGVYEGNVHTRPPSAGTMNVVISSSTTSTRPVILVFTNYEPVNWVLDYPPDLNIEKVILIAYYSDLSSVTTIDGISQSFTVEKRPRGTARGYGSDRGGGNTAEMLVDLQEEFGSVASLAGTYRADSWTWTLPTFEINQTPTTENTKASTSMSPRTSSTSPSVEGIIPCVLWLGEGTCYHVGSPFQFDVQCVNGFCECHAPIYDTFTCLPSVGSCQIRQNSPDPHATPHVSGSSTPTVYSCIGQGGNTAEVHVLGVYEGNVHTRPPSAGTMNVVISSSPTSTRPVILVFTNYEPVNWILDYSPNLNITKVILIAYYSDLSSVRTVNGISQSFTVEKRPRGTASGYGSDSGGGNTAEMLVDLQEEFGSVASLAGTYRADSWTWTLPTFEINQTPTTENTKASTSMSPRTSSTSPSVEGIIPCVLWLGEGTCYHVGSPFQFDVQCVNGFCECHAPIYDTFTCLPSVGSCQIRQNSPDPHATPHVSGSSTPTVYSCIGQGGNTAEVHVLGVYEGNVHTRPPSAGTMNVVISSSPTLTRPVILVFTNYEPVNWILDYPPNLNITKVILTGYYSELSSVTTVAGISQSFAVERNPFGRTFGFGSDRGGGHTAELLVDLQEEYGPVASFAGTYKADSWTWTLPVVDIGIYPTPTTVTMSSDDLVEVTEDTWTEYAFRFEDNWNSCHGSQYVRRRPISDNAVGRYIGVILCTSDRYKLVMADDLNDEFKNIADTSGHGQDHCEFVEAPSDGTFTLDSNFWESPSATGYYRDQWGEDLIYGTVGGGTGASWTGRYYPMWYECGVTIP